MNYIVHRLLERNWPNMQKRYNDPVLFLLFLFLSQKENGNMIFYYFRMDRLLPRTALINEEIPD